MNVYQAVKHNHSSRLRKNQLITMIFISSFAFLVVPSLLMADAATQEKASLSQKPVMTLVAWRDVSGQVLKEGEFIFELARYLRKVMPNYEFRLSEIPDSRAEQQLYFWATQNRAACVVEIPQVLPAISSRKFVNIQKYELGLHWIPGVKPELDDVMEGLSSETVHRLAEFQTAAQKQALLLEPIVLKSLSPQAFRRADMIKSAPQISKMLAAHRIDFYVYSRYGDLWSTPPAGTNFKPLADFAPELAKRYNKLSIEHLLCSDTAGSRVFVNEFDQVFESKDFHKSYTLPQVRNLDEAQREQYTREIDESVANLVKNCCESVPSRPLSISVCFDDLSPAEAEIGKKVLLDFSSVQGSGLKFNLAETCKEDMLVLSHSRSSKDGLHQKACAGSVGGAVIQLKSQPMTSQSLVRKLSVFLRFNGYLSNGMVLSRLPPEMRGFSAAHAAELRRLYPVDGHVRLIPGSCHQRYRTPIVDVLQYDQSGYPLKEQNRSM